MSKRILSLVLTLALVLGSFSMAFADTAVSTSAKVAKDVEGTQYEKAVATLEKLKVLEGYPDATFRPGNTITRAEFAAVVSRITGLETAAQNAKGKTIFTDVTADNWASGYINVAEKGGLINGVGNGRFAPESKITYEQAITMIVRALGYEHEAQRLGGYPVGYLSVASRADSETGVSLLKDIAASEGSQGVPATRGLVALLLNNSLEIRKMVQVGFGDQARWVVSGSVDNSKPVYLFSDLGLIQREKVVVSKADSKKQTVQIEERDKNDKVVFSKVLKADKDFNYEGFDGLRVTAWYNKEDQLIVLKDDGAYKVIFDAVEVTKEKEGNKLAEIKLVTEDVKYDVSDNVKLNDSKTSKLKIEKNNAGKANFAKVIVDDYNNVSRIDSYNLNNVIVVKDINGKKIEGYDSELIDDASKYIIMKDGKQISYQDLSDLDVLVYDSGDEYAAVLTNVKEGKIERVYEGTASVKEGFKLDGKVYDLASDRFEAKYITEKNLRTVDKDVLNEMRDNGEIKVYFTFDEKVVFIDGEADKVASNYALVTDTSTDFSERTKDYVSVDVLNSEGKRVDYKVEYDSAKDEVDKKVAGENMTLAKFQGIVKEGSVIKISVNSDNKVTKVEGVSGNDITTKESVNARYIGKYESNKNATVFWKDGEKKTKDFKALSLGEAQKEFDEFTGIAYGDSKGKLVAVVANETNKDSKVEDALGIVREVRKLAGKDNYDVKFEIDGVEKTYSVKDTNFDGLKEDSIAILQISKDGDLKAISETKIEKEVIEKVDKATSREIDGFQLRGQYYEEGRKELEKKNSSDAIGKKVVVYFMEDVSQAQLVIIEPKADRLEDVETPAEKELKEAKEAFNTALTAAKAPAVVEGKTAESVIAYNAAILTAQNAFDIAKTVEEVNAAKAQLEAAKDLLVPVDEDKLTVVEWVEAPKYALGWIEALINTNEKVEIKAVDKDGSEVTVSAIEKDEEGKGYIVAIDTSSIVPFTDVKITVIQDGVEVLTSTVKVKL